MSVTSKRGTHGLRKRCPQCKKVRRFHEPPGDIGDRSPRAEARVLRALERGATHLPGTNQRESRKGWKKIDGRWVCGFCNGARRAGEK